MSKGFSLVEILLAVSVLGLVVTALVGGLIYGQQSTALSGMRFRAVVLAEEGLEAVRNIREAGYTNLADGTFGLTTTGNQWNLSGSSDTTDVFTRQIVISSVDLSRKSVTSTITWQQNSQRSGSVSLTTYFTNWVAAVGGSAPPTSCGIYCQSLGSPIYVGGVCRENTQQCSNHSETYQSGGDSICATNFPGDASHDTCCCQP